MSAVTVNREHLLEQFAERGVRPTPQRELILSLILQKRNHPTADEIFARAKARMPSISLATVYNCLDTLVGSGLVRQVNVERGATRFCPNLSEHAHFHDHETGVVHDIALPADVIDRLRAVLPPGYDASSIELTFHGKAAPASENN
jgi:Fur family peroxide stress response transcriptional regulator